ncbi:MAG: hypothetical protein KAQ96_11545, partial [Thermoplasmata archaeon]|nr:hypothetical protein [Thermoplasmata archaeon]
MKWKLALIVVIVCLMLVTPVAAAAKGGNKGGGKASEYTSTLGPFGDFTAGPTTGVWAGQARFEIQQGGEITIEGVPDEFTTRVDGDGINWFEADNYRETFWLTEDDGSWIKQKSMKPGTYIYYQPSDDKYIGKVHFMHSPMYVTVDGEPVKAKIGLDSRHTTADNPITIVVTKKTITVTGTDQAFDYWDMGVSSLDPIVDDHIN